MFLKKLKLTNFRLFLNKEIHFEPGINIISGLNAVGKTTILEAIYYLSFTKSFRTSQENELFNILSDPLIVSGSFTKSLLNTNYEYLVTISKNEEEKRITINGYQEKRVIDYIGKTLIVSFTNKDCSLLVGSPSDRRKLFEPVMCQISPLYLSYYNSYKKLVRERNVLLKKLNIEKNKNLYDLINVIDHQLESFSSKLIDDREYIVSKVNQIISRYHSSISGNKEEVSIKYVPNVTKENYYSELQKSLNEDIKKGSTSVGPHRDDYKVLINSYDLVLRGSQGQQKNFLISLKMAFLEILRNMKNDNPILLLDDVFGDLDKERQNNLINCLDSNNQTIITTSSLGDIESFILDKTNIIYLNSNSVDKNVDKI